MEAQRKITTIIVDDSDLYRVLLFKILSQEKEIEVISLARSGLLALPRVRHYKPDIVILDMEMPDLDGLKTLEIIRKESPETKVIMFCSKTPESARQTIKALELGAKDFVTKPEANSSLPIEEYILQKIVTKIKALGIHKADQKVSKINPVIIEEQISYPSVKGKFDVCAIGISTGGPDALRTLLPMLPANLNGSILIVQHMPPFFTKQLADSLNAISNMQVLEASDGIKIERGNIYIAPGGKHMVVTKKSPFENIIQIIDTPPEESCKPSVNVLFRTIANVYGTSAIGIIMTGMGQDGYKGFLEMKKSGAYLLAQNEESCLIFGMPMLPIKEKLVSETQNVKGLGNSIIRLMGLK